MTHQSQLPADRMQDRSLRLKSVGKAQEPSFLDENCCSRYKRTRTNGG